VGGLGLPSSGLGRPSLPHPAAQEETRLSGAWKVGSGMPEYRFYTQKSGRNVRALCQTDREAIESAMQMKGRLSVEIWNSSRLVMTLKSTDDR